MISCPSLSSRRWRSAAPARAASRSRSARSGREGFANEAPDAVRRMDFSILARDSDGGSLSRSAALCAASVVKRDADSVRRAPAPPRFRCPARRRPRFLASSAEALRVFLDRLDRSRSSTSSPPRPGRRRGSGSSPECRDLLPHRASARPTGPDPSAPRPRPLLFLDFVNFDHRNASRQRRPACTCAGSGRPPRRARARPAWRFQADSGSVSSNSFSTTSSTGSRPATGTSASRRFIARRVRVAGFALP